MHKNKGFFVIIPARGSSKRLPNKNILDLCGKPLIAWTIEAGLNSKYIDELMVSTDSEKIAEISKAYRANVPFLRPAALAVDTATSVDVVIHAINFYKNELKKEFDYIVFLQPTSPLRNNLDVDLAIEFLVKKDADSIVSVCEAEYSPLWTNILPENLSMENFLKEEIKLKRSQALPMYYRLNGAIYICKIKKFLLEKTFFLSKNIYAFIMEQDKSIDIDTELDFKLAKLIMNKMT